MKTQTVLKLGVMPALILTLISCSKTDLSQRILLDDNWFIQQSTKANQPGSNISTEKSSISGWYHGSVPSTIMGVLCQYDNYKDVFYGREPKKG